MAAMIKALLLSYAFCLFIKATY